MMARPYHNPALVAARERRFTSIIVRGMGYREIADLAGVEIKEDGSSPKDFFYQAIRATVSAQLEREEAEVERIATEAELKALMATSERLSKYMLNTDAGEMRLERKKAVAAPREAGK